MEKETASAKALRQKHTGDVSLRVRGNTAEVELREAELGRRREDLRGVWLLLPASR